MHKIILGFIALGFASSAAAQVTNGGFETGDFTGWAVLGADGNAVVPTATIPSPPPVLSQGQWAARIDTTDSNVFVDAFDTTFNLAPGTLELIDGYTNGAGIYQDVMLHTGEQVSFVWHFDTIDFPPLNDTAFLIASGPGTIIRALDSVDNFSPADGWFAGSFVPGTDGTYRVGFAVFNEFDTLIDSTLYVDDVRITPVPETGSWLVWLSAATVVTLFQLGSQRARILKAKPGNEG
jgi:hypothetical protein